jgi:undecaprenyl-diphosphatase
MHDALTAIILGIVEGLTEFVPVSSTAHLLLAKMLLGLPDGFWDTFIVLIQLGAILAVVVLYFQKLWSVLIRLPSDPAARRFVISLLAAMIPATIIGFGAHDFIKKVLFDSPQLVCWALLIGGIVLMLVDRFKPAPKIMDSERFPYLTAFLVGFAQCLAMIPGVSRSGATIASSLLLGVERKAAAEFSFFLAIPTMVGAFGLDLYKSRHDIHASQAGLIAVGFVVSFIVGLAAIKTFITYLGRHGFALFGWWRIVVGGGGLILLATHVLH